MRKIKEVLRLKFEARLSHERIAAATGVSKGAVSNYVQRAAQKSLGWPLPAELDDAALERLLFPQVVQREQYTHADYAYVHQELKRKAVTLQLLWEEYRAAHGERAYQYSQFCWHYQRFRDSLARSMRQTHRAGEKLFIDYSGDTVPVINAVTGEILQAQIFVASMGASKYTYAEATWTQQLPDWIASHVRMFDHLACVPEVLTPDNIKSAIKKACRYEPEENSTYADMARHFGCVIIPARPYRPKDKGKVESAVLVAQRWILAALRHRQFYHLQEMNSAIAELLEKLNQRTMRHVKASRRELYERLDRPALKPLPAKRYEYAEHKQVKANIDYHVSFDDHFYSVPHTMVGEPFWCRATHQTVELYHKGKRITSHVRSFVKYGYSTHPEHRPASHRAHLEWTPSRLINWGKTIGPHTAAVVEHVLNSRPHPEQGYRSVLGLLRMSNRIGTARLELACERSIAIGSATYPTVKMILKRRMEAAPLPDQELPADSTAELGAANVRGRRYYS